MEFSGGTTALPVAAAHYGEVSMARRSKGSQSRHDAEVRRQARELEAQGFDVRADLAGYPQPDTIGGLRPDVFGVKGKRRIIVEVETPDSVDSARDRKQQAAFRRAAGRSRNTTFRRKLTD